LIAGLYVVLMWLLLSHALDGKSLRTAFGFSTALLFMSMLMVLFASIKQIADTGFPPRRTARELAAVKGPILKPIRWLVTPGASSSLACMMLVALMVIGGGALLLGNRVATEAVRAAEAAPVATIGDIESVLPYALFSSSPRASDVLFIAKTSYSSSSHTAQPSIHSSNESAKDAASKISHVYYYAAFAFLLVMLSFGLIARMISFTSFGSRAPAVWSGLILAFVIVAPVMLGGVSELNQGPELAQLSPVRLLELSIQLTRIDIAQTLDPTFVTKFPSARADAFWGATPSLIVVGTLLLLGSVGGFVFGRSAKVAREAAGGRWPVPRIPPPREFTASAQTALVAQVLPAQGSFEPTDQIEGPPESDQGTS